MSGLQRTVRLGLSFGAAAVAAALLFPAASIASPPPAKAGPGGNGPHKQGGSARGIVQSVGAKAVTVKELDGTTVRIPVAPSTHVFFDGRLATLADVQPGLVAIASWKAGKGAAKLQIYDASATVAVVQSTTVRSVIVTMPTGSNVTIRVSPKTHVLVDGKPANLHAVKPGFLLVIKGSAPTNRPAGMLRFLRPG